MSTTALIDSGATVSFLPREIAIDILNLPITHRDLPVEGAGGMFMCDVVRAKQISVMKGVNSIHEYYDRFMHIPKAPIDLPYGILGRDSLFRTFDITFREIDQRFVLK